jgi:hypothetical protein
MDTGIIAEAFFHRAEMLIKKTENSPSNNNQYTKHKKASRFLQQERLHISSTHIIPKPMIQTHKESCFPRLGNPLLTLN